MKLIQAAFIRITRGTFGICVDSGESIPLKRLQDNPLALRTAEEQQDYEHRVATGVPHSERHTLALRFGG
jgi:RNA polymerase-binding transcription factor DksA